MQVTKITVEKKGTLIEFENGQRVILGAGERFETITAPGYVEQAIFRGREKVKLWSMRIPVPGVRVND